MRPEFAPGAISPCWYDPAWSPTASLLPSSQIAFASEMGYRAWKWLLLLLLSGSLAGVVGVLVYTQHTGVETVVAATTYMY
eukprot:4574495-Prymnesium_polylepis.1